MQGIDMVDTICLRCGYPHKVPERAYNKLRTCPMCRTPAEEEMCKKRIARYLANKEEVDKT